LRLKVKRGFRHETHCCPTALHEYVYIVHRNSPKWIKEYTKYYALKRHLYLLGLLDTPLCRKCELKRKPRLTFFVNVRPWPHSDIGIWVPCCWNQRTLRVEAWGSSGALAELQGSLDFDMGHKGPVYNA